MKHSPIKGYVYIFSNPKLDNLYKVGKTKDHPEVRAKVLSQNTGTIGKFEVVWFKEVPHIKLAEDILQYIFREWWHQKEFYRLPLNLAINRAEKAIDEIFGRKTLKELAMKMKEKTQEIQATEEKKSAIRKRALEELKLKRSDTK